MQISLARALTDLKTTVKKIDDILSNAEKSEKPLYVGIMRKKESKIFSTAYDIEEFNNFAKSNFDSIVNLIERQRKLKLAISRANNTTNVVICDKTMTISEAIFYKQTIEQQHRLSVKLKNEVKKFIVSNEQTNKDIDEQIAEMAKQAIASDKKNTNIDDTVKTLSATLGDPNRLVMIDPIKAEEKARSFDDEYEKYMTEIDFSLSEINAKTNIEVDL